MPTGPFTISVDYLHGTLNGCIRVAATLPSITIYRIPHDRKLYGLCLFPVAKPAAM